MCISWYWSVVVSLFDLEVDWLIVGISLKQVDSPINRGDAAEFSLEIICLLVDTRVICAIMCYVFI